MTGQNGATGGDRWFGSSDVTVVVMPDTDMVEVVSGFASDVGANVGRLVPLPERAQATYRVTVKVEKLDG